MDITVGIPTYNEEDSIVKCIKSCLNQTLVPKELIVVASGCTDSTVPRIKNYIKSESRVKLIIEKKRRGKISAINKILDKASGEYIVHTDGDVILRRESIRALINYLKKYPFVSAVSGRPHIVNNNSNLFYKWANKTEEILRKDKISQFKAGNFFHICGYIFAHRRGSILKVPSVKGATDATMGSILKKKGLIVFDPKIQAIVKHPSNVRDFIRQKARIRYGFLHLNKKVNSNRNLFSELSFIRKLFTKNSFIINIGFFYVGLLYLASWLKAYRWFKKDRSLEEIWQPVISTK